jgi:type II secretory pathway component PulF
MVKASELSGGLLQDARPIADTLVQQIETISMVRGAMIYPGIIGHARQSARPASC